MVYPRLFHPGRPLRRLAKSSHACCSERQQEAEHSKCDHVANYPLKRILYVETSRMPKAELGFVADLTPNMKGEVGNSLLIKLSIIPTN